MKTFLICALAIYSGGAFALSAETNDPAGDRLARSAKALRDFREAASDTTQTLLAHALCLVVAPRRDSDQSAADMKGFASCRPNLTGDWSGPAAIVMEGGGIFWPVYGSRIDVILLATNPSAVSHFSDPVQTLGADPRTIPGPVRPDQNPPRTDQPVIFAYGRSDEGIVGISIGGATLSEDGTANTVLYGTRLSNSAILKRPGAGRSRPGIELFLAALPLSSSEQAGTRTE